MAYLRARRLLHRDLKPHNLLLSYASQPPPPTALGTAAAAAAGAGAQAATATAATANAAAAAACAAPGAAHGARLLIADFGLARALEPSQMARTVCGSPLYMAPEVLRRCPYDAAAEMWSVGVCMHELLASVPPFTGNSVPQLLEAIDAARGPPPPPPCVGAACASMVAALLQPQPARRLTIEQMARHPFLMTEGALTAMGPQAALAAIDTHGNAAAAAAPAAAACASPPPPPPTAAATAATPRAPSADQATAAAAAAAAVPSCPRARGVARADASTLVSSCDGWEMPWHGLSPRPTVAAPMPSASAAAAMADGDVPSSLLLDWALADASVLVDASVPPTALHRASGALATVQTLLREIRTLEHQLSATSHKRAHRGRGTEVDGSSAADADGGGLLLRSTLQQLSRMLPARRTPAPAPASAAAAAMEVGSCGGTETDVGAKTGEAHSNNGKSGGGGTDGGGGGACERLPTGDTALLASVVDGVKQAQWLHQQRTDECRRLRSSLRDLRQRQAERAPLVTSAFQFDDRVVFLRRTAPNGAARREPSTRQGSGGATAAVTTQGGGGSSSRPAYVALREGSAGPPCFLARASEASLLGAGSPALLSKLPAVAIGKVVHVEMLRAPLDDAAATMLGVRAGEPYGIITAEMCDSLAPEVRDP